MKLSIEIIQQLQSALSLQEGKATLVDAITQISELHHALLNKQPRKTRQAALRLAAIALSIHEHGDERYSEFHQTPLSTVATPPQLPVAQKE